MKRKPSPRKKMGYTLFESIITLSIIVIITICVTTGISASNRLYRKSLFSSESEILSATVDIALSDVFRYATNITDDGTQVNFSNNNYSIDNGHLLIKEGRVYINLSGTESDDVIGPHLKALISDSTYTSMKATDITVNFSDGLFTGNYTIQSKLDTSLTKTFNFTFRSIA